MTDNNQNKGNNKTWGYYAAAIAVVALPIVVKEYVLNDQKERLEENARNRILPKMDYMAITKQVFFENIDFALSRDNISTCQEFAYIGAITTLEQFEKNYPQKPKEVYVQYTESQLETFMGHVEKALTKTFNECKVGRSPEVISEQSYQRSMDYLELKYQDAREEYSQTLLPAYTYGS